MPGRRRETKFYDGAWAALPGAEGAAHAVHITFDVDGKIVERRFENLTGRLRTSTDPRAGRIMREERAKHKRAH